MELYGIDWYDYHEDAPECEEWEEWEKEEAALIKFRSDPRVENLALVYQRESIKELFEVFTPGA